jgi:hypothetical protein
LPQAKQLSQRLISQREFGTAYRRRLIEPMSVQRIFSMILALGGVLWGAPCFVLICMSPLRGLLILGPVYLVTFAILLRASVELSRAFRTALWSFSALIYGLWLTYLLRELFWLRLDELGFAEWLVLRWCGLSLALSIYCIVTEPQILDEPGLLVWRIQTKNSGEKQAAASNSSEFAYSQTPRKYD